ncbi:hypothetical protein [Legionella sp. 31fI33]|nr:hypothetical protein [Legionella sp. 31fI33]MCC5015776.1 hypothetical protein [Legionella sp. 31fI33]
MDDSFMDQEAELSSTHSLSDIQLYLYGVHKNEARNGIKLDLIGENDAMQNYSSGNNPSISRDLSRNVFFTNEEILAYKSLAKARFWSKHTQGGTHQITATEEKTEPCKTSL